ncbi:MAG: vitamin B12 dependent-methionine synthase activation domain-containing protein [Candidatus Omnitrophica bacterium]|nr:vitamin B12 dependent-methionine synthase activation domain-containing protein [Candidatus Omnitrophota bacterium]
MAVQFFDSISIKIPKDDIYRRLGYVRESTVLKKEHIQKTDLYIEESFEHIHLKGCALRLPVKSIDNGCIDLSNGISFKSKDLVTFLSGSSEVLIMGATAGDEIMHKIKSFSQNNDLARSVVYDAAASEIVDAALTWIMNFFKRELIRFGLSLDHRRFSAGYGDFALENQKAVFDILEMKKIGVNLTKELLMLPEKSVTAISGIGAQV